MSQHKTVAINGVQYDAHSGMPVSTASANAEQRVHQELQRIQSVHAKGVHKSHQRSSTLNREFVAKASAPKVHQPLQVRHSDIQRPVHKKSPHISKFAPARPVAAHKPVMQDIGPVAHPHVARAHAASSVVPPKAKTSHEIKTSAIEHALANAEPHKLAKKAPKQPRSRKWSVVSAALGLFLIAGYFTYINMPSLSVRVAAAQAGIDASYPEYRPIGYRLDGPVAYRDGEVSMRFASNTGPQHFALAQVKSSWDSTALLEKFVNPKSKGNYATYSDAGLTIYTYGNNAAWVNGGILYSVEGSARLSNEQVRRIATSL